jgi:hypothetical protein
MEHLNKMMRMQVCIFVAFDYLLISNCVIKLVNHIIKEEKVLSPGHQNIKYLFSSEENEW